MSGKRAARADRRQRAFHDQLVKRGHWSSEPDYTRSIFCPTHRQPLALEAVPCTKPTVYEQRCPSCLVRTAAPAT